MSQDDKIEDLAESIDPTKLEFEMDTSFLNRELIITVRALDDKTFARLVEVADLLRDEYKKEIELLKSMMPNP